jgi:hypothetical protein
MKKAKSKTNDKFVTDLMNFNGPIVNVFVIECLSKWSAIIAKTNPKEFDNALIAGEAWVAAAKIVKAAIDEKYGSKA